MIYKPYSKGSLQGAALCHIHGPQLQRWWESSPPASACPGQGQPPLGQPVEVASLLRSFGWGPGHKPSQVSHGWPCTTPYHLPHLEHFISEKEVGMLHAFHGIRKYVPITVSERVTPWVPSPGQKKLLPVIFTNPEAVQEQINSLWQFQMPGDLFSAHLQYLLGRVREICSRQQSVTDKAKCTSGRGQDRICT